MGVSKCKPGHRVKLWLYYSGRKAARVKFSVAFSNSFLFFFLGRDGPKDKTSGHKLSSRSRSLYSGREVPS